MKKSVFNRENDLKLQGKYLTGIENDNKLPDKMATRNDYMEKFEILDEKNIVLRA